MMGSEGLWSFGCPVRKENGRKHRKEHTVEAEVKAKAGIRQMKPCTRVDGFGTFESPSLLKLRSILVPGGAALICILG